MKKLILFLPFLLFLLSCSKDSDSNSAQCDFVGGTWCPPIVNVLCIEFRDNGEYRLDGSYLYIWRKKNGSCTTIELVNRFLGSADQEITIISITGKTSGSKMVIGYGGGVTQEYIKL